MKRDSSHPTNIINSLPEGREALLPDLKSVTAAGDSDFEINRLIFSEQRRRADAQGCAPEEALQVSMSSDGVAYADAWGAVADYYQEGIGDAELFIEYGERGKLKEMVKSSRRRYPQLFSHRDSGEIEGYAKETGVGWVLYRLADPQEYSRWTFLPR